VNVFLPLMIRTGIGILNYFRYFDLNCRLNLDELNGEEMKMKRKVSSRG
jgi:hypothetical protein